MIRNENHASDMISYAGKKLILFSKITEYRSPPGNLSLRWLRPSAIWLMDESGNEQVVKVHDPTRQIILSIFGLATVGSALLWLYKLSTFRLNNT